MAVSSITKRALATALKELMGERPFSAISIGDICQRRDMNRKSFYYHFKDKYDLLNWIYDTEFLTVAQRREHESPWEFMADLLAHLYADRAFYARAMEVTGQNSFQEHFRELMEPVVVGLLTQCVPGEEATKFQTTFFTDAVMAALGRWLTENSPVCAEEMLERMRGCFFGAV